MSAMMKDVVSAVRSDAVGNAQQAAGGAELTVFALRDRLSRFQATRNGLAVLLLVIDVTLFGIGQGLVLSGLGVGSLVVGGLLTWIAITRLFVIGHDACHGAYTDRPWLNRLIGRIAFLASLTPFSLWRVGHNVVHHGFNNLRGRDFVWEPHDPESFAKLSPARQRMERIYRSAIGPGIYYGIEIWWTRLYFPAKRYLVAERFEFTADSLLVTAFAALWLGTLGFVGAHQGLSLWAVFACGFVLPFVLWNWTMGLVIYLHHTHPDIPWFADKKAWTRARAQVSATIHLRLPRAFNALLHYIMEHPAHHLDASIPLYHLRAAQRELESLFGNCPNIRFSLREYLRVVRTCKLFDYTRGDWAPFPRSTASAN
jgi:acyl-lipid omega-6 desaturase (Delta-12 desaturase)